MCLLNFFLHSLSGKRGKRSEVKGVERKVQKSDTRLERSSSEMVEWMVEVMTIYHAWRVLPLSWLLFSQTFISFRYYLTFYSICTHTPLFVLFPLTSFVRPQMMRTFSNLFYYNIIKQNTSEWCLIPVWFFPFAGATRFGTSASKNNSAGIAKPQGEPVNQKFISVKAFNWVSLTFARKKPEKNICCLREMLVREEKLTGCSKKSPTKVQVIIVYFYWYVK